MVNITIKLSTFDPFGAIYNTRIKTMTTEKILASILAEVEQAEKDQPIWPSNLIHGGAIVSGESGELIKAILDHSEQKSSKYWIMRKAVQTAATTIRFLKNFNMEEGNE